MFSGIVESVGRVESAVPCGGSIRLRIDAPCVAEWIKAGASVSVSGVCLTVAAIEGLRLSFDVIRETLERSTLGRIRAGDRVNLERSLAVGDRLDGHFVQGHVDGTAAVRRRISTSREFVLWLAPEAPVMRHVVPKGSIAVDGVSLTIAAVRDAEFSVALIPTTLERTTLGDRREGDRVNIESDILVRSLVHYLDRLRPEAGLTVEKLIEQGHA